MLVHYRNPNCAIPFSYYGDIEKMRHYVSFSNLEKGTRKNKMACKKQEKGLKICFYIVRVAIVFAWTVMHGARFASMHPCLVGVTGENGVSPYWLGP